MFCFLYPDASPSSPFYSQHSYFALFQTTKSRLREYCVKFGPDFDFDAAEAAVDSVTWRALLVFKGVDDCIGALSHVGLFSARHNQKTFKKD